ncbi:hypothetical protein KIH39_12795 [Telmatocola sphagniphila]|uniref:Rhodanese domain-containing protein n=1 Tax=Telmatocola sphagniphila TaxID=1123043 RepID=A0A8E6BD61_9BACT|nr:rhodanese-like domain-containing protein [Telmatocola sphagniphila]QVL34745.1 hypothetical protein KIH39_12795 [Telmatocola sphagniphila]
MVSEETGSELDLIKYSQRGFLDTICFAAARSRLSADISPKEFQTVYADAKQKQGLANKSFEKGELSITVTKAGDIQKIDFAPTAASRNKYAASYTFNTPVSEQSTKSSGIYKMQLIGRDNAIFKNNYSIEVSQYLYDKASIEAVIDSALKCIPIKERIVAKTPIEYEWNGVDAVKSIDLVGINAAEKSRFSNVISNKTFIVSSIAILLVGLIYFKPWKRFSKHKNYLLCVGITLCYGNFCFADDSQIGPYCGLHCVYASAQALNEKIDFETLLSEKFVSSHEGSSTEDLIRAISETTNLKSFDYGQMSIAQLRATQSPVILHTRSPGMANYDHWVTFLGFTESGKVTIYDPPRATMDISTSELLSIWDGSGLIVSRKSFDGSVFNPPMEWIAIVVITMFVFSLLKKILANRFLVIPIATVSIALGWHIFSPVGFWNGKSGIAYITASYFHTTPEEIDFEHFDSIRSNMNVALIDARPSDIYRRKTIPGALNLPINTGYLGMKEILHQISPDKTVIVFCQSENCLWADEIAGLFVPQGYKHVLIYRGGMNDWNHRTSTSGK